MTIGDIIKPVCTYKIRGSGEIVDIFPTITGGYFERTRNYKGLLSWGATSSYDKELLKDALKRKKIKILKGKLP